MQRFVIELTQIKGNYILYTFKMDNYGGKLIRFKGEDEYMINTLSLQEYWDSVLKTTSLASEDVSVLVFYLICKY